MYVRHKTKYASATKAETTTNRTKNTNAAKIMLSDYIKHLGN